MDRNAATLSLGLLERASGRTFRVALNANAQSVIVAFEQKLTVFEWKSRMDILTTRKDEQFNNLIAQIGDVNKKESEPGGTLKWIGRIVIGGIMLAIVGFAMKVGFNIRVTPWLCWRFGPISVRKSPACR